MIRMNNLQTNGWDLSDLKHIELEDDVLNRYRLQQGDLLFNRTNSKELVGKCEVFKEDGDWVFASYLIRVQLDASKVLPDFVSFFLNSPAGRIQIDQVSRQIAGMSNVNAEELRRLEIPLPPLSVQRQLIAELQAARATRDRAKLDAEELLDSFEGWSLEQMGIEIPTLDNQNVFAIRRASAKVRIDPFFHAPEFVAIERAIRGVSHATLGSLVSFSDTTWDTAMHSQTTFGYIEISGVDRRRGQATAVQLQVAEAPSRARMMVKADDIIVSLTRPHHGSIALLNGGHDDCIASTGFAVIRAIDNSKIHRQFLWVALRLSLCLKQMQRRASGGNYPAITQDELAQVIIPIPDMHTQILIVEEIIRRGNRADNLEMKATAVWRDARANFEKQLLKGSPA